MMYVSANDAGPLENSARHARTGVPFRVRLANAFFALLFAFSVAVQANDPDPAPWMLVYGSALGACVLWHLGKLPRRVAWGLAAGAALWGLRVALGTALEVPVGDALTDWQMHAGGSEELRESLGLVLVAVWCGVLGGWPSRAGGASPSSSGPRT